MHPEVMGAVLATTLTAETQPPVEVYSPVVCKLVSDRRADGRAPLDSDHALEAPVRVISARGELDISGAARSGMDVDHPNNQQLTCLTEPQLRLTREGANTWLVPLDHTTDCKRCLASLADRRSSHCIRFS